MLAGIKGMLYLCTNEKHLKHYNYEDFQATQGFRREEQCSIRG